MSYSLDLYFEPPVRRHRLLQHFAARRHFSIETDNVVYENRHTGVYFFIRLRSARKLFQSSVVSAEFERSTTIGPAISGSKPKRYCPTSSRCFSHE